MLHSHTWITFIFLAAFDTQRVKLTRGALYGSCVGILYLSWAVRVVSNTYRQIKHPVELEQDGIPETFQNDIILRQFTCLITRRPILHPIGDPNGRTYYERRAIIQWLKTSSESPVTRQPLQVEQLVETPALAALIAARLLHLEQQRIPKNAGNDHV